MRDRFIRILKFLCGITMFTALITFYIDSQKSISFYIAFAGTMLAFIVYGLLDELNTEDEE